MLHLCFIDWITNEIAQRDLKTKSVILLLPYYNKYVSHLSCLHLSKVDVDNTHVTFYIQRDHEGERKRWQTKERKSDGRVVRAFLLKTVQNFQPGWHFRHSSLCVQVFLSLPLSLPPSLPFFLFVFLYLCCSASIDFLLFPFIDVSRSQPLIVFFWSHQEHFVISEIETPRKKEEEEKKTSAALSPLRAFLFLTFTHPTHPTHPQ